MLQNLHERLSLLQVDGIPDTRVCAAPTCLVVIAIEESIAAWAATPITSLHPGVSFVLLVIGPAQLPRVRLVVDVGSAADEAAVRRLLDDL